MIIDISIDLTFILNFQYESHALKVNWGKIWQIFKYKHYQ